MTLNRDQINFLDSLEDPPSHWQGTGALPLHPDPRDLSVRDLPGISRVIAAGLPDSVDLTGFIRGPILNQGAEGACFPAGTRIRMADGSEKPIEQVRLLDEVLTAEGRTGLVEVAMVREEQRPLLEVHLRGHQHLQLTSDHPLLTQRGYVIASALRTDDYVALPRYLPEKITSIRTADYVTGTDTYRTQREGKRYYANRHGAPVEVLVDKLPDEILLSRGFGQIVGLFLAEGHTTSNRAQWTFGDHEAKTLVQELVGLLHETLGVSPFIQTRAANHQINVTLFGKHWRVLFEHLCATGSGSKRLHPSLCAGPREFLVGVFEGWMDGDGHEDPGGRRTGVTVSSDLALGMYDIAQAIGLRPTIRRSIPVPNAAAATRRPRWDVVYATKGRAYIGSQQTDTHVWRKVREVVPVDRGGSTWVYNLQVRGDNSYVAEGIGVHNCVAFSTAHLGSIDDVIETNTWPAIDAETMYRRAGGTGQNGVDSRLVLQQALDSGMPAVGGAVKVISAYAFVPQDGNFSPTIMAALALGYPIVLALLLPADFGWQSGHSARTTGYHQICLVGYYTDKATGLRYWIFLNSWGASFGHNGVGSILISYIEADGFQNRYAYAYTVAPSVIPTPPPPPPPPPVTRPVAAVASGAGLATLAVGQDIAGSTPQGFSGSLRITQIQDGNPPPPSTLAVTGYSPAPVTAGRAFTIQGRGFTPDAQAAFAGAPLFTAFVSPTWLNATAPSPAATQTAPVTVSEAGGAATGPPLTVSVDGGPPPGGITVHAVPGPHKIVAATVTDTNGAYLDATCEAFVNGLSFGTRQTHPAPQGGAFAAVWVFAGQPTGTVVTVTTPNPDGTLARGQTALL